MKDLLVNCHLCPRNCHVNRHENLGFCHMGATLTIANADLFFYEEPIISGDKGSGAIFFTGCNLKCVFCQNEQISSKLLGKKISIEKFSDICISLQEKGALNINLVTPTHFIPLIRDGLLLAKKKGLCIPIIYNTSSYENVESLKLLEGLVDVYLPDLKYYDEEIAVKYSQAYHYFEIATAAIAEMYRQVGSPILNDDGIITKGVVVRHLLLPKGNEDSKKIVEYLYHTYGDNIYISIMNQYTPMKKLEYDELNYIVTDKDYNEVIDYACELGVVNAFAQVGSTQKKSFIPDFTSQDF